MLTKTYRHKRVFLHLNTPTLTYFKIEETLHLLYLPLLFSQQQADRYNSKFLNEGKQKKISI